MDTKPDTIRSVGEARLLRVMDKPRSTRRNWVKKDLLDDPPDGRYDELAVVESVALAAIFDAVGAEDGPVVWRAARSAVAGYVATPLADGESPPLDLVFDQRWASVTACRDVDSVAHAARLGRPVCVIPLGEDLSRARRAFWVLADAPRADARRRDRRAQTQTDATLGSAS
jgi:hypothetical protein